MWVRESTQVIFLFQRSVTDQPRREAWSPAASWRKLRSDTGRAKPWKSDS
jgi:hypothetical protein